MDGRKTLQKKKIITPYLSRCSLSVTNNLRSARQRVAQVLQVFRALLTTYTACCTEGQSSCLLLPWRMMGVYTYLLNISWLYLEILSCKSVVILSTWFFFLWLKECLFLLKGSQLDALLTIVTWWDMLMFRWKEQEKIYVVCSVCPQELTRATIRKSLRRGDTCWQRMVYARWKERSDATLLVAEYYHVAWKVEAARLAVQWKICFVVQCPRW